MLRVWSVDCFQPADIESDLAMNFSEWETSKVIGNSGSQTFPDNTVSKAISTDGTSPKITFTLPGTDEYYIREVLIVT